MSTGTTSPSVTVLPNGQVAFAYRGDNGHLWIGQNGPFSAQDTQAAMAANTIAPLQNGQVLFAFQGSNGHLWVGQNGLSSAQDMGQAMRAGTRPSIGAPAIGGIGIVGARL